MHKIKLSKLVKQLSSIDAPLDDTWQTRIDELLSNAPFQATLGTIGGGNHFAESQAVDKIYMPEKLPKNFNPQCLQLVVHSGSRGLGQQILRTHVDKFSHTGLADLAYSDKATFRLHFVFKINFYG
ncbi:RtcB family protein [Kingella negevensis]|uniref:3'-phosphate/5'-hydroxy nucleic acid ligase n=1 Tax=Kingella negevensis TaxID=1522312 RepID=A0A238HJ80_9NEIS|nr:RtcB family protein [Kingella negevensis]MDK4685208.1 RtcB family protein [Kingella negevensis]MDK4697239.1 RtcB family protein [Kingella negevensis]MDK4708746.1 RtcB family protein [Kingella negevensis]MDK4709259.1 RtcB family protein [Kingella negevensis]WII94336.1 RtcB family protein [Kingella negevensis]